jgi:hypothetical protein
MKVGRMPVAMNSTKARSLASTPDCLAGLVPMASQIGGDCAAKLLPAIAGDGTFLHLGIIVLGAFVGAPPTGLGARRTGEIHQRALARHQLAREFAGLLAHDARKVEDLRIEYRTIGGSGEPVGPRNA